MKSLRWLAALAIILGSSGVRAENSDAQWILDRGSLPRCLVTQDSVFAFQWNRDSYQRRILVRKFGRYQSERRVPPDGSVKPILMSLFDAYCSDRYARIYLEGSWSGQKKWNLPSDESWLDTDDEKLAGVLIPDNVRAGFDQASLGATVYRAQGADEMASELKVPYSLALNQELTQKYGVGFSAEVYRDWLNAQPKNSEFKKRLDDRIRSRLGESLAHDPSFTAVVVKGFGYTLTQNRLFRDLVTDLQGPIGVDVDDVYTESFGTMEKNAELIRTELEKVLATGHDVVVIAGCIGAAEALQAMAELRTQVEGPTRNPQYGRILVFVGLSPMITGSFLADWATALPREWLVSRSLYSQFKAADPLLPTRDEVMAGVSSLRSDNLGAKSDAFRTQLPRATVYLSLAGVKTGDGLAPDPGMRALQEDPIRSSIAATAGFAANDGYIAYPGSVIPDSWGLDSYALTAEASHALLDGSYGLWSLSAGSSDRVAVIRSLLELLTEQAKQKNFR